MPIDSQKSISPEEIGRAYDRITERWTSSAFPRSNGIAAHRRAIDFLKTRESALDIGCGANGRFFDLFSAWDSIWHIPLAEHERVFKKVLSALAPNGVFVFTTGGMDEPGEKFDDYMGLNVSYSVLGLRRMLEVIFEAGCTCRHLEYDQYPESHVYVIVQRL